LIEPPKLNEKRREEICQKVGLEKAINALSGGVDKSTITFFRHKKVRYDLIPKPPITTNYM